MLQIGSIAADFETQPCDESTKAQVVYLFDKYIAYQVSQWVGNVRTDAFAANLVAEVIVWIEEIERARAWKFTKCIVCIYAPGPADFSGRGSRLLMVDGIARTYEIDN